MSINLDSGKNSLFKELKDEKIPLRQMLVLITKLLIFIIVWNASLSTPTSYPSLLYHAIGYVFKREQMRKGIAGMFLFEEKLDSVIGRE